MTALKKEKIWNLRIGVGSAERGEGQTLENELDELVDEITI